MLVWSSFVANKMREEWWKGNRTFYGVKINPNYTEDQLFQIFKNAWHVNVEFKRTK